jgi:hypothetical protein
MHIGNQVVIRFGKLPPGLCFIIGFLAYLGIFYPGFMCYDSVNQLIEAREGVFSDWHPPLMSMIWRVIDTAVPGPAGMLCLQSALVWLGAYLIYRAYFKPYAAPVFALWLSLLLFAPPVFGINGAIIKDVFMWGVLLIAFGLAGHIRAVKQQSPWPKATLILSVLLCLWIAMLLRHNAVFATIPILGLAVFRGIDAQGLWGLVRAVFVGGALAAALFLTAGNLNQRLIDRQTRPWVANAVFDISGVLAGLSAANQQERIFTKLANAIHSTGTLDTLLTSYSPIYWREVFGKLPGSLKLPKDSIGPRLNGFGGLPAGDMEDLRSLWLQTVYEHPGLWLRHRLGAMRYLLGLAPDGAWSPMIMSRDFPLELAPYYAPKPQPTAMQSNIETFYYVFKDDWWLQPWPYLLINLGVLLAGLLRFKPETAAVACLSLSALFHEAGLMIAAPSPDYRYSHYMIFCGLLSLLLLLRPKRKSVEL